MKQLVVLIVMATTVVHLATGTGLSALHDSSSENRAPSAAQYCTDLNPQNRLDVEQVCVVMFPPGTLPYIARKFALNSHGNL